MKCRLMYCWLMCCNAMYRTHFEPIKCVPYNVTTHLPGFYSLNRNYKATKQDMECLRRVEIDWYYKKDKD